MPPSLRRAANAAICEARSKYGKRSTFTALSDATERRDMLRQMEAKKIPH